MQNFSRDLRHSLRSLAGTPVLAITIVLTVGLGIGATTAMFAAIHAVLMKPLPYAEPDRLVRIYMDSPPNKWSFSVADYLALEEQQTSFQQVAGYARSAMTFTTDGVAERIRGRVVSPSYFSLLGTRPRLGRDFISADGQPGGDRSVIVSHGFWTRRLGGEESVLGRPIQLDGEPYMVVGVLPQTLGPLERESEFFAAARWDTPPRRGPFFIVTLGRLSGDATPASAAEELRAISKRIFPVWQSTYQDQRTSWGMMDLKQHVLGDIGPTLLMVLCAVGFVLLVAATNAANLLVARAAYRQRELAVRSALGASRGRLLQHLLSESGLLALFAALVGLGVAAAGVKLLTAIGADHIPRSGEIALGGSAATFLVALTVGSAMLFGLVPSLHGVGARLDSLLRSGGRSATDGIAARRLRRALVAAQFAVATPLLVASGLLISSLTELQRVEPGFDSDNILTAAVLLPEARYSEPGKVRAFWDEAEARVSALPGVEALAFADGRPPAEVAMTNDFELEDDPVPAGESRPAVPWVAVTPGFFEVMGIPLLKGRLLDETDGLGGDTAVVVDRAWADRYFPGQDALGKRFQSGGCTTCPYEFVVGIVGAVKYRGLDSPDRGTVYWPMAARPASHPMAQITQRFRYFVIRAAVEPESLISSVREVVRNLDPELPLSGVATLDELVADSLTVPRNLSAMVAVFASVALLLSVIGIYGVMSYFVQQRTRDMGIRLALGGEPLGVVRLVVSQGMRIVAGGIGVGLIAALVVTRYMSSLLFEVGATDPVTFAAVAAVTLAFASLACLGPARRAAGVDPAVTLREE